MAARAVGVLLILCSVAWTAVKAQQVHLRRVQEASPPDDTSLSASEYEGLLDLLGGNDTTQLTSLYRTSVHGTTYGDLLDRVGDAKPIVFVVRNGPHDFGVYISKGLRLPDDPFDSREYESDVWWFSLADAFGGPIKIEIPREEQYVAVAGREGNADESANVLIGGALWLGWGNYPRGPSSDIRSCFQVSDSEYVPEGYTRVREELTGSVYLGGYVEVLHVVQ
ncbi:unnamed protein product [Vitrella brassicaformis CCMP3155]|uniref:TLDc domain-containing protein n=1 Tax=Vitrella brassicaformis (strain CCMP3155) TaxID=1169540 RepID=A0A0G4GTI0_VITBC|nr:unnamed protein product [Vitrella brassicaformis CCMP3155]|eukprot:CEM34029.1 unnamed protein product [Vitrella brassicaformis CCMP3155]